MSEILFAFTLGPVQTFIAEARRASDLYMGSRILVEMAAAAAQAVRGDLIFPTPAACIAKPVPTVPNRFIAIIQSSSQAAAQAAHDAAKGIWDGYVDSALRFLKVCGAKPDKVFDEIWDRQTGKYLEFYWVACPFNSSKDYTEQFKSLLRALDARKRTRSFDTSEEEGQKDSLSGMRAALRTGSDKDATKFWARIASSSPLKNRSLLKSEGERLDAIGAIKRFGNVDAFPSTSTMAAVPFLRAAQNHQAALDKYSEEVSKLGLHSIPKVLENAGLAAWTFDGDALFLESFTVKRLKDDYGMTVTTSQVNDVSDALRELYERVKPVPRPRPYYAVLKMDGDHVGERLSQHRNQDEHRTFSDQMRQFAKVAAQIVNRDFAGRLVYSGGDDVLALAAIDEVLPMAATLQDKYRNLTGGSISAGIAIAHHLSPLDRTLAEARHAEHVAKNTYRQGDKGAVHIAAFKRSGEPVRVGTIWGPAGVDPIALFKKLTTAFQNDLLSSKLAYSAVDELPAFETSFPGKAHESALKRLIKRHREAKSDSQGLIVPEDLAKEMNQWAQALDKSMPGDVERVSGAVELAHWLLLARFIAGGGD